ncbi:MAG: Rpp14/Pop5 family protein [Nanoarchaeota archaeon]
MLKLRPSARNDRRYILIRGSRSYVEKAILEFIGVLGWAEASPVFVYEVSDRVIVAINRKSLSKVRTALAMVKDIEILRVSGTLKGLEK